MGRVKAFDAAAAAKVAPTATTVLFTGRVFDTETGLYYFRARYFEPEVGVFISRDPLGFVDGKSVYQGWFDLKFKLDPFGLSACEAAAYAAYAVCGAAAQADLRLQAVCAGLLVLDLLACDTDSPAPPPPPPPPPSPEPQYPRTDIITEDDRPVANDKGRFYVGVRASTEGGSCYVTHLWGHKYQLTKKVTKWKMHYAFQGAVPSRTWLSDETVNVGGEYIAGPFSTTKKKWCNCPCDNTSCKQRLRRSNRPFEPNFPAAPNPWPQPTENPL